MFVISEALNRIVALNTDTGDYQLILEGFPVEKPYDAEFVSTNSASNTTGGNVLFVSMWEKDKVVAFNAEGSALYTFAVATAPTGILHFPALNLVAIATATNGKEVFFFDTSHLATGGDDVEPLEMEDAVGVLLMGDVNAGAPMYLARGENADEVSDEREAPSYADLEKQKSEQMAQEEPSNLAKCAELWNTAD